MRIIEIVEDSLVTNGLTEMLMNKEIELYKSMEDYGMYKIKNTDIYICMINTDSTLLNYGRIEVDYNTTILDQLYKYNKLNATHLMQLCNLSVFM